MKERIIDAILSVVPGIETYNGDNMIEDLGIDSHDIFNIVIAIEDEFDIEIPPTKLKIAYFTTVESIVELVEECSE